MMLLDFLLRLHIKRSYNNKNKLKEKIYVKELICFFYYFLSLISDDFEFRNFLKFWFRGHLLFSLEL